MLEGEASQLKQIQDVFDHCDDSWVMTPDQCRKSLQIFLFGVTSLLDANGEKTPPPPTEGGVLVARSYLGNRPTQIVG